jgi:hypothetical protein
MNDYTEIRNEESTLDISTATFRLLQTNTRGSTSTEWYGMRDNGGREYLINKYNMAGERWNQRTIDPTGLTATIVTYWVTPEVWARAQVNDTIPTQNWALNAEYNTVHNIRTSRSFEKLVDGTWVLLTAADIQALKYPPE